MTADMLRPKQAAERYGVSERTLARWAADGLIGWSKVQRVKHYAADDIAQLLGANTTRRTVVPLVPVQAPSSDWENHPLWATPSHTSAMSTARGRR